MSDVKLKKVVSRKDKDIDRRYFRYDITIPQDLIDDLGWEITGEKTGSLDLEHEIKGKELRIKRKKKK